MKKLVSEALVHIPNMYCTAKGLKSEKVKKKKRKYIGAKDHNISP